MIRLASDRLARLAAAGSLILLLATSLVPRHVAVAQVGPTHTVTWDSHSLMIDGHRVLLYSGEFHYWRLPSVSQWTDRLEKMKAAGLNAVSMYFDWQYHSSAPGQYDFSGVRDIDRLLTITDHLGLYVIARVGPYMNGEADAGGLPGWVLSKQLFPRSQSWNGSTPTAQYSPLYVQYSKEWYDHVLPIIARHQVNTGGSVLLLSIENEYSQLQGSQQYMHDLYGFARADGITVPIFHNDFWFRGDWRNLVDLYAYDSYPYGFSCCHQWWDQHFHGIDTWEASLRQHLKIKTPMFVSELQGGSFDPWGGKGYGAVASTLGPDWLNVLDQSALAQGTAILNTYMFVGGTTWGYMGEPGVYTSYDYGAPISESGALRPAYYAAHRLGMFLQSYGSVLAGADAVPGTATAANRKVITHARVNRQTHQAFIFLRHGDAGAAVRTRIRLQLPGKTVQVPQKKGTSIRLPGHGAELLTANVNVGPLHMNYSTSQVLTETSTSQGDYLVLHGPTGSDGEADFVLPSGSVTVTHNPGVSVTRTKSELRLNYQHTTEPRTIAIRTSRGTLRILVTSTDAASRYWVADGMVIAGPDLVRSDGDNLTLSAGQSRGVIVYGAPQSGSLRIDGRVASSPDTFMGRVLLGSVASVGSQALPSLKSWRFQSESPEVSPTFDDSMWTLANHTFTTNPNVSPKDTLLADDYGFHYGFVWYRGHFTASGKESGITISARQSYSVYLNGTYLGAADASLADPPHSYATPKLFSFPAGVIRPAADNVISVLTESLGHDEGWVAGPLAQSPQGILGAAMRGNPTAIVWRVQGDAGGETPADQQRGILNASGLYGERQGWYTPEFDDAAWQPVNAPDNWKSRGIGSGVGWYRTHFTLNMPNDVNQPVGLVLPHVSDKALIWVNGWLLGRYWEQRGPQHEFYLPDGILNSRGDNVLAIAVWNRGHVGGLTATPRLAMFPSLRDHQLQVSGGALADVAYWHTQGNRIVDSAGRPVRIHAVNWFGTEDKYFVPAGLEKQRLDAIVAHVAALGFNAIRLPFSNYLVEQNPVVRAHLGANRDLQGLHALDVIDRVIASARQHGLRIILNDVRDTPGTQPQPNGLWYMKGYPESSWIRDWQTLVTRYQDNPTVVGVDLLNEPHTAPPGPWSLKTYLHQGATWGAYKGVENPKTDWRLAAERGGDAVLAINPRLLVFVEGLQQYPNAAWPGGVESYWWGGIFMPARQYPVELSVPHQLVYSPHEYGPVKYAMPFFGKHMTYRSMSAVWDQHWGFLEQSSYPEQAPIFIGEFGTCGSSDRCVQDLAPGSQGLWFSFFMRYLKEHPQIGWSFWALNGTNHAGSISPNYIFSPDWRSIRLPALLDTFRDVEVAPPPSA